MRRAVVGLVLLGLGSAREVHPQASALADSLTAIRGARVVTMEDSVVREGWTVLVREGRIVRVAPDSALDLDAGATVLDARGRYLLPGLFDAHMHLDAEVGARPGFGEAPLYLAHGVTSVVSMKGEPGYLSIRERIRRGELLAPTLYTAGPFLDEPVIAGPAEARSAVRRQQRAGYDLVKLHEAFEFDDEYHFLGNITYLTTTGVDQATLRALTEEARDLDMPALGHIPPRGGLEGMLEAGLSLAHTSILLGAYFWPSRTDTFQRNVDFVVWGAGALIAAVGLFLGGLAWSALRRREHDVAVLVALGAVAIVGLLAIGSRLPGDYLWLGDERRILAWSVAAIAALALCAALVIDALRELPRRRASGWRRMEAVAAGGGAILVGWSVATYWMPLMNRSTDAGLAALGRNVADAGVWVQTTLSVEDTLVLRDTPNLDYLDPRKATASRRWAASWSSERIDRVRRGLPFFESLLGALHEAGVPLMLGTDAMGFPLIVPGSSVHDEMRLLEHAGLSPYEILVTATRNPARFLGKSEEVGTITPGKRADFLLVEENPLIDLETLRRPLAVMASGRWLDRAQLDAGLAALAAAPPPLSVALQRDIESDGVEEAATRFRARLEEGGDPTLAPGDLNRLGYGYLREGRIDVAVVVFELNVLAFPEEANPWDSLGEAYLAAGDSARAIEAYGGSLELNPGNDNARRVLREDLGVALVP